MAILFGRNQLPVVISFFICGIISGVFCDLLRIKRRIFFNHFIIVFFDDIIFFAFCTLVVIFNAYCFNDGNMKWYEIPVMIAGFVLYRKTLSRIFTSACFYVSDLLKSFLQLIISPIRKAIILSFNALHAFFEKLLLIMFLKLKKRKIYMSAMFK